MNYKTINNPENVMVQKLLITLSKDFTYPTNHGQPQYVYHRTNNSDDFLAMFLQQGLELVADGDDEALDHKELGVDGE